MANGTPKKDTAAVDQLFVVGLDGNGKPRGARFAKSNDLVVSAALDLRLAAVHPASAAFAELGMKLPPGRLYASGKTFIPNIRRDLHDKLVAVLAETGDGSTAYRLTPPLGESNDPHSPQPGCLSPITSGLPRSWETISVGHMVLVHESPMDGWWEAVVIKREDEILTLRFRDYPKQPTFIRHINTVGLVNPGPA